MIRTLISRGAVFGWMSALVLVSTVAVTRPAHAQNAPVVIGVVDEDKLADGYKQYAAAVAAIDKRAQDLDAKIPAREFLTADEAKSFDALIVLPTPTDKQKTDLDAQVKTGLDRRAEYLPLVGKAVRTVDETARMGVLQKMVTDNGPILRTLSEQLLQLVRQQQDDTDKKYTDQANSVVGLVAQDKKLLMIVRKKALIWSASTVDVTDEVLARLNKA